MPPGWRAVTAPASGAGTFAARPAASAVAVGFIYFATDDNGGTPYRSNGSAWTKMAAGALETGGRELAYNEKTDGNWVTTNTAATDIGAGTSITFVAGARAVALRFGASDIFHSVANTIAQLLAVRTDTSAIIGFMRGTHATANGRTALGAQQSRMSGLTIGQSYTVKLQTASGAAGTLTIPASVNNPVWIQAVEL